MKPSNEPSRTYIFRNLQHSFLWPAYLHYNHSEIVPKKIGKPKNWIEKKTTYLSPFPTAKTGRKNMRKILQVNHLGTLRRSWQLSKARASRTPEVSSKAWRLFFAVQLVYPAWLCQQLAIENGHRNSGFSHSTW